MPRENHVDQMRHLLPARTSLAGCVLLCAMAFGLCTGCSFTQPQWVALPEASPESPPANLPLGLRQKNWTDSRGSGSCVIASSVMHFRWMNNDALADYFRANYDGGQTATSIKNKWAAAKIPFAATEDGDPAFLEWASRTRRGAIIWYFPSHCVFFCGFTVIGGANYAILCDNNRIDNFIRIPKQEFLRNWRGYGGFACTALTSPAPSLPQEGYREIR